MAIGTALLIGGAAAAAAPAVANMFKSPAEKQALQLAERQQGRLGEVRQELNAMGRPIMDAEVNRLNQVLAGNLGISDVERMQQERMTGRALGQATSGASSMAAGLRGLGSISQSAIDASADMAAQNALMERNNRLQLQRELAGAESRAEYYNEITPFEELRAEEMGLTNAIDQNQYLAALMKSDRRNEMWKGVGQLGESAMGFAMGPETQDIFAEMDRKRAERIAKRRQ